jgi:hypothetical protein
MKTLLTYLTLFFLLVSCEEQTAWELQNGDADFIVVDGIITNELKVQTLTISKPVDGLNGLPMPVTAATVLVSYNQLVYSFHEDNLHPGTYLSDKQFSGIKNKTYSLLITTGNKVYSAKAMMAAPAEFAFLRYQKNANDNKYRISWVANGYNPNKAAMYEILLNWSGAPGYENTNPDSCKATLYYYTLPTLDVSEVFAPISDKITFPAGTEITERRYSLTDEHAAFMRAVLLETTWQGGFFNTASANIPTNMSEGARGFFGACGVLEKRETAK